MNRNLTALIIFTAVLIISAVHLFVLDSATKEFVTQLDMYKESVISDSSNTDKQLLLLLAGWEDYYSTASFLTRSGMLDDMAADVVTLGALSKSDSAALTGELDSLRYRAHIIYDNQMPHLRSIL